MKGDGAEPLQPAVARTESKSGSAPSTPNRAAREPELLTTPPLIKVKYASKHELVDLLERFRYDEIEIAVDDVVDMVAELRGIARAAVLQLAVTAWFYHAIGAGVLEAECHEQPRTDDSPGGLLLFRVRLDADHDQEVRSLPPDQELTQKLRGLLVKALPTDLMASMEGPTLDQMVSISWTKCGSIELGGVAALGLVTVIVMAIGIGACRCEACRCCTGCPCTSRPGHTEGREYSCALRSLRQRGAEFQVAADGSATLRVPPSRDVKWRCPECPLL